MGINEPAIVQMIYDELPHEDKLNHVYAEHVKTLIKKHADDKKRLKEIDDEIQEIKKQLADPNIRKKDGPSSRTRSKHKDANSKYNILTHKLKKLTGEKSGCEYRISTYLSKYPFIQ